MTALADMSGRILAEIKTGPSNPRNAGLEASIENIAKGINKFKEKAEFALIGMPSVQEEYGPQIKSIERKIKNKTGLRCSIVSDQLVAFRSGSDEKDGEVLIAGTGCVAHGWKRGKEEKTSGWGWLADEGSAMWAGKLAIEKTFRGLDGRDMSGIMAKMILEEFKSSTPEDLAAKIYGSDFLKVISLFCIIADRAAEKGDKDAKQIMSESGRQAALSANTVSKKLKLFSFPLVSAGSMFKSKDFRKSFEENLERNPICIYPKDPPVSGAIKLALERIRE